MNATERRVTIDALEARLRWYRSITPCCGSCEHYQTSDGPMCAIFKEAPPEAFIKGPVECEAWTLGDIPF